MKSRHLHRCALRHIDVGCNQGRTGMESTLASRAALKGLWLLFEDAWFGLLCLAVTFAVVVFFGGSK